MDAPLVMHVRVWLMGLKSHQLNKMEKYLHRAKPNRRDTHRKLMHVDGMSSRNCYSNSACRRDHQHQHDQQTDGVPTRTRTQGGKSFSSFHTVGSLLLMNTVNQFCFRKRTISCGYPFTKISHSDFCSSLCSVFLPSLTSYLNLAQR